MRWNLKSKPEIRRYMRERLARTDPRARERAEQTLLDWCLEKVESANTRTILLYASLPDEIATYRLIDTVASREDLTVLLPRVRDGRMEAVRVTGSSEFRTGKYDIHEPVWPVFSGSSIQIAIVPGLAFDPEWYRLGRGGGYYDRFFAENTGIKKIGVGYDFQCLATVARESHDIRMDEMWIVSSGFPMDD